MQCITCSSEVGPFYTLSEGIHICHTCKAQGSAPHTDDTERPKPPSQEHTDIEQAVSEQENTDTNQKEISTENTDTDQAEKEETPPIDSQTKAEPENTDNNQQTESKPQRKKRQ